MIKKVAILTSGGDSSGMNTSVRALVKSALASGITPYLVYEGYKGLHQGRIEPATTINVDQYIARGGTFILSARYLPFKEPKVREETRDRLKKMGIDAVVVIGGDGSYTAAQLLHELGVKTIGLPGTIDNDIASTDVTIGFDTALTAIVENIDRVRDTMNSHSRAAIVEVMGRNCGDLALHAGIATGAEVIVTSEARKTPAEIAAIFKAQRAKGKNSLIAIVTENIFPDLKAVEKEVQEKSGVETRSLVLGHVQRGGIPTASERVLATVLSIKAIELLKSGKSGLAVGMLGQKLVATPILEALKLKRESRLELTAKANALNQA